MVAAIAFVGGIVGLGLLAVKRQSSSTAAGETIAPAVAIVASGEALRA
jgi:hypothetical protein